MIQLVLAVACSVAVSLLLKLAPQFSLDVRQGIAGNYPVAALLVLLLLDPQPQSLWQGATLQVGIVLLLLGVLLPGLFVVLAKSVVSAGMVRTDAAMRLSLLLPLLAAFLWFGEVLTTQKGIAILLGLTATICIVTKTVAAEAGKRDWHWPVVIFFGMGLVDILFKEVARMTALPLGDLLLAVFLLAALLAGGWMAWLFGSGRAGWHSRNLLLALLLGGFNFGNIYFFVRAHQELAATPALVFLGMNIGVILLATLVGAIGFKEKLSRLNMAGLALAVAAVVLIAAS